MNCKQVRELLSDYIDNLIENEDVTAIEAHLAQCESCRKEYEELLHIVNLLSELPEKKLPDTFDERLHEALLAVNAEREAVTVVPVSRRKSFVKRITSVAAIFVVGLFVIAMYNNSDQLMFETMKDSAQSQMMTEAARGSEAENGSAKSDAAKVVEDSTLRMSDDFDASDSGLDATSTYNVNMYSENLGAVSGAESDFDSGSDSGEGMFYSSASEDDEKGDSAVTLPEENASDETETDSDSETLPGSNEASDGQEAEPSRGGSPITAYDKLVLLYSTDGAIFKGRDPAAIMFYTELLDETLAGVEFEIISCDKEEGIWIFEVETVSTDEEGNEMRENAVYNGQDGTLWKEETTEITTKEAIEESLL